VWLNFVEQKVCVWLNFVEQKVFVCVFVCIP
jgi:hypothetical protein